MGISFLRNSGASLVGNRNERLVLSTELITKSNLAIVKRFECRCFECNPFVIRSNEGLTLKTSALESLYGGQRTFSYLKNVKAPNQVTW